MSAVRITAPGFVHGNMVDPEVIYIQGPGFTPSFLQQEDLQEYTMFIGDGKSDISLATLQRAMVGKNPKTIVVLGHGSVIDGKHHIRGIGGTPGPSEKLFETIKDAIGADSTASVVLRSCYGATALKEAAALPPRVTLMTTAKEKLVGVESVTNSVKISSARSDAETQKRFLLSQYPLGFAYSQNGKIFTSEPPATVPNIIEARAHFTSECRRMQIARDSISKNEVQQYIGNLIRENSCILPSDAFYISLRGLRLSGFLPDTILTDNQATVAVSALMQNNIITPEYIFRGGGNVNALDPRGKTIMHFAAKSGVGAKDLVRLGGDPTIPDNFGTTPLMMACLWNKEAVVKEFTKPPYDRPELFNLRDEAGNTALNYAVNNREIFMHLMALGANPELAQSPESKADKELKDKIKKLAAEYRREQRHGGRELLSIEDGSDAEDEVSSDAAGAGNAYLRGSADNFHLHSDYLPAPDYVGAFPQPYKTNDSAALSSNADNFILAKWILGMLGIYKEPLAMAPKEPRHDSHSAFDAPSPSVSPFQDLSSAEKLHKTDGKKRS